MFSQACVKNSVQRGWGVHPPPLVDTPLPRQTATTADGTHPTGMHSCFIGLGICLCQYDSIVILANEEALVFYKQKRKSV